MSTYQTPRSRRMNDTGSSDLHSMWHHFLTTPPTATLRETAETRQPTQQDLHSYQLYCPATGGTTETSTRNDPGDTEIPQTTPHERLPSWAGSRQCHIA